MRLINGYPTLVIFLYQNFIEQLIKLLKTKIMKNRSKLKNLIYINAILMHLAK